MLTLCSRGAYQDQEEDQGIGGLGQAVAMKSRGVTYKVTFTGTTTLCY